MKSVQKEWIVTYIHEQFQHLLGETAANHENVHKSNFREKARIQDLVILKQQCQPLDRYSKGIWKLKKQRRFIAMSYYVICAGKTPCFYTHMSQPHNSLAAVIPLCAYILQL